MERELCSPETPAGLEEFDFIACDIRMPGVTGLGVLAGLRSIKRVPPIVFITAFGGEQTRAERTAVAIVVPLIGPCNVAPG
jgi:CheY-like chemotaxis protein